MALRQQTPIATFRKSRKLSLQAFAKIVGCDRTHLYRIERGEVRPSADMANTMAKLTDGAVTRDQILFPEDYIEGARKPVRSAELQGAS